MPVGLGDWYFSCALFTLESGSEESVREEISSSLIDSFLFKAIGPFDLASICKLESLNHPSFYQQDPRIIHTSVLTGVPFVGVYNSPDILSFCNGAAFIGLACLEVDNRLTSAEFDIGSRTEVCQQLIKYINDETPLHLENLAFFGGFGKAELLVMIKSNNSSDIWKFLRFVRNIRVPDCWPNCYEGREIEHLPVFSCTKTIPLLSYNNIHSTDSKIEVVGVIGDVLASINIKCWSGFDCYVKDFFEYDSNYKVINTIGNNDVSVTTSKPIGLSKLIEDILTFRLDWNSSHNCPVATNTQIQCIDNYDEWKSSYLPVSGSLGNYDVILSDSLQDNNPQLSNVIKYNVHRLSSLYKDSHSRFAIQNLQLITSYIIQLINEHQAAYESRDSESLYDIEGSLEELIDTISFAILQRSADNFDNTSNNYYLPIPFSDGIISNLIATEIIINFIFKKWCHLHPEWKGVTGWLGFSNFSNYYGFKLRIGETIYLPTAAITSPFLPEGNWLTISHELSHALYNRLQITSEYEEKYEEVRRGKFSDHIIEKMLGPDRDYDNEVYELFAHWYDFYHFYDADIDLYYRSIWPSWMCLPIVRINYLEYFFRSFVVFIYRDYEQLLNSMRKGEVAFKKFVNAEWDQHLKKLNSSFPETIEHSNKIIDRKDALIGLFLRFNILLIYLFSKNKDESFRKVLNRGYQDLQTQTLGITDGKIITTRIENPYLLFKEIWKQQFPSDCAKVGNSLIISLRNMCITL